MKSNYHLTVTVKGTKSELYNGPALSVTSVNKKGKFDILPFHINFISLIKDYVIIRKENKKEITFPLETGVLKANEDKVKILIGV
jgi:F0F1-type ATP synthase epsilon subunit